MSAVNVTENYQVITPDFVEATVTTDVSKKNMLMVKKFQKDLTVWDLKQRLELMTGRNASTMTVTALTAEGDTLCTLSENYKLLGSYPLNSGVQFLVEDPMYVPHDTESEEDLEKRYQLSEEQYSSRRGTLKEYLMRNKLGKYNPDMMNKKEEEARKEEEERKRLQEKESQIIDSIEIGQRCQVSIPNQVAKRGEVMFKGTVKFTDGLWVGVKYDEPFGKNDGSVNGVKYFEAPQNYGAFVKSIYVEVGDFPEITDGLEYDDEF